MSSELPVIMGVDRAHRALRADMAQAAQAAGFPEVRESHNAVFATLAKDGSRISDMARRSGMTKQSMAETVRDLEAKGLVMVGPDPEDGRAKLVTYTERGWECVQRGEQHIALVETRVRRALGAERLRELKSALATVADVLSPQAS